MATRNTAYRVIVWTRTEVWHTMTYPRLDVALAVAAALAERGYRAPDHVITVAQDR